MTASMNRLLEIMARLRDPRDGCPWDVEQTFATIAPHTIEEAYEVADAITRGDLPGLKEELGDLLLQVVFHSRMAEEQGTFAFGDVAGAICDKLVSRHPHVFGEARIDSAEAQTRAWESHKAAERAAKAGGADDDAVPSTLAGIALALPALIRALKLQSRAARVGFDWPEIEGVLDKVREEIEEIKDAETDFELASEIGDLFFAIVNVARWKTVDAESALRGTNLKFKKRFGYVEQTAKKQGRSLSDMKLEEMDVLWNEAKRLGL